MAAASSSLLRSATVPIERDLYPTDGYMLPESLEGYFSLVPIFEREEIRRLRFFGKESPRKGCLHIPEAVREAFLQYQKNTLERLGEEESKRALFQIEIVPNTVLVEEKPITPIRPTRGGIELICAYYQAKYEISIEIAEGDEEPLERIERGNRGEIWGTLIMNGDHCFTVISSRKESYEHIVIDPIGYHECYHEELIRALQARGGRVTCTVNQMQADRYSCWVFCLELIKDGLLEIKKGERGDIDELIERKETEDGVVYIFPERLNKCGQIAAFEVDEKEGVRSKKAETMKGFRELYAASARVGTAFYVRTYNTGMESPQEPVVLSRSMKEVRMNSFALQKAVRYVDLAEALVSGEGTKAISSDLRRRTMEIFERGKERSYGGGGN